MNNLIDYIDSDEGRDCTAPAECFNCKEKASEGALLSEILLTDGGEVWACDDCAAEQRAVEQKADELAKLPSCTARQSIIDDATTTQQLVNQLRAHDQAACPACEYAVIGRVA